MHKGVTCSVSIYILVARPHHKIDFGLNTENDPALKNLGSYVEKGSRTGADINISGGGASWGCSQIGGVREKMKLLKKIV